MLPTNSKVNKKSMEYNVKGTYRYDNYDYGFRKLSDE